MALASAWATLIALITLMVSTVAAFDRGGDITNNLFSDLAPLLSLFGEQFAKQFISQSMGWLEHIIFAMAPLGILTVIVSAIRVGGPSWLRAVIGRARENRAMVEVELMSSTSHEVCELWNGQGVIRTMGKAEIQQIVYLEEWKMDDATFGLYTVESAINDDCLISEPYEDPLISKIQSLCGRGSGDVEQSAGLNSETEQKITDLQSDAVRSAPNISLNLHGGSKSRDLYWAALCGIVLQSGMLIFSAFTVYNPGFSWRFPVDSNHVRPYAFPVMATGTIILVSGMLICSAVVEYSTEEKRFVAGRKYKKQTQEMKLNARVLWLQQNHVVSDQSFESYVIFGKTKRDYLLSSRRNELEKKRNSCHLMKHVASNRTEAFTVLAVALGIVGFILQFQGLRGMNWSTSIAQLVCVFLMTVLRAIIRRGLIITPVSKKVLDQHEMDWLALRIVWNPSPPGKSKPPQHLDECNFWPKDEDEFRPDEGCQKDASPGNGRETEDENFLSKERWIWTIPTNHQNYAYAGTWDFINLPPSDEAQKALGVRRRLGQLTKWVGIASKLSIAVASAIDIVMNTLFNDSKEKVFVWYMKALIDEKEQKVHFKVQKDKDKWKTNATDIEAALSLWIFHIHYTKTKSKTNKIESGDDSDWLRRDVEPKREIIRLLGSDTKELRRDINWWIGDGIVGDNTNNSDLGESIGFTGVVGFKGMEPQDQTSDLSLVVKLEASLESSLAQHMFSAFMWAITDYVPPKQIDIWGQTTIGHVDAFRSDNMETLKFLRFENKVLTGMANAIQRTGLGSLQDAYLCIIPPLSCAKKLPVEAMFDFVRRQTKDHEVLGRWDKVVPLYRELFKISKTFGTEHRVFHKATAILIDVFRSVTIALGRRRTDEAITLMDLKKKLLEDLRSLQEPNSRVDLINGFAGLYSMQNRLDPRVWNELLPGVASKNKTFEEIHKIFEHPPIFSQIMSNECDRMGTEYINAKDILGWSPLHYAAIRRDVVVVRALIGAGADPKAIDLAEWTPLHYAIEKMKEKHMEDEEGQEEDDEEEEDEEVVVEDEDEVEEDEEDEEDKEVVEDEDEVEEDEVEEEDEEDEEEEDEDEDEDEKVIWALLRGGASIEIRGRDGIGSLHCAAKNDHWKLTNLLLQAGANIEIQDNTRKTPLHWAAYNGCNKVINVLLPKGVNIGALDDYGRTAIHLAAIKGRNDTVDLLLNSKAGKVEIDARDRDRRTALHLAAKSGYDTTVRVLLKNSAEKEAKDRSRKTALSLAVENGHETTVQVLLEKGANIESKDDSNQTPLHLATEKGYGAIVGILLELKANIKSKDSNSRTPIHLAIAKGHEAIVNVLLDPKLGANKEAKDLNGWTPLHLAAKSGHEAMVGVLLANYAEKEAKDYSQKTALGVAVENGHETIVQVLLEKGANIESKDVNNQTALHLATEKGSESAVHILLEKGADITAKDRNIRMPLHLAAIKGNEATVRMLFEKLIIKGADIEANIEAKDRDKRTPLHLATIQGHEAIVPIFLDKGANIESKDGNNRTPLHLAIWKGHEAIVRVLIEKGSNIEVAEGSGWTPLHYAISGRHEGMARFLVEKDANVEVEDSIGWRPLHEAASNGLDATVQLLLEKGANINAKNHSGKTAFKLATEHEHETTARLLQQYDPHPNH